MNNQHILKYIISAKASKGYYAKKKKEEEEEQQRQDAEITDLYNRGYFNPPEYEDYINRHESYQSMINLHAERMNDMYYFSYVVDQYSMGYLDADDFDEYFEVFIRFYYYSDTSYDRYIRELERTLRKINSNY